MTKRNEKASEPPRFTPAQLREMAKLFQHDDGRLADQAEVEAMLRWAADVLEAQQQARMQTLAEAEEVWNRWRKTLPVTRPFGYVDGIKFVQMLHALRVAGEPERTP